VIFTDVMSSPVGLLGIAVDDEGKVVQVSFRELAIAGAIPDAGRCKAVVSQLAQYFRRERKTFDLVLAPAGTDFQMRVWDALRTIPYGETTTYREMAVRTGNVKAIRAVGRANGANPIPIIVPCHRVIGSDGSLTGFGGGMRAKALLLELEGARSGELFG
jgi:methylated-DNA-[protein]-cysteine S-methyltransferase